MNNAIYRFLKSCKNYLYYVPMACFFPKTLANVYYKRACHRDMDLNHPIDLNEKINWLKFYSDTSRWTELADKYKVRQFVKDCGCEDTLIPLLGKWDSPDDIDFDLLPNRFVLKTNHGSGDVIIVKDKSTLDYHSVRELLRRNLNNRYGYTQIERHYLKIHPCIIAEELLEQDPSTSASLIDYKIWCFDGEPYNIWVVKNRTKTSCVCETYDLNWQFRPDVAVNDQHYIAGCGDTSKPSCFEKLIEVSRKLSKGFPEVRVDLYAINNNVYFGEMTFTSMGGYMVFYTKEYLEELGNLVKLPSSPIH